MIAISPTGNYRSITWGIHFFSVLEIGLFVLDCAPRKTLALVLNGAIWGRQLCARRGLCFSLFLFVALVMLWKGRSCKKVICFFKMMIYSDFRVRFLKKYKEFYLDLSIFKAKSQSTSSSSSSSSSSASSSSISCSSTHFK